MKRSFRAATAFTGAAACAVAFTPTADAATARITPDTLHAANCVGNASTPQLHLYYAASQHHPTPACVSGPVGSIVNWPSGKHFSSYCGGEYSGSLVFAGPTFAHFTHGAALHHLYGPVYGVEISRVNTTGAIDCAN
jgi:hypothetical protein